MLETLSQLLWILQILAPVWNLRKPGIARKRPGSKSLVKPQEQGAGVEEATGERHLQLVHC